MSVQLVLITPGSVQIREIRQANWLIVRTKLPESELFTPASAFDQLPIYYGIGTIWFIDPTGRLIGHHSRTGEVIVDVCVYAPYKESSKKHVLTSESRS